MKTLSLTQPWASLVAVGAKQRETRSWSTPYRGQLAIHASKGFPQWAMEYCVVEPFLSVLAYQVGITLIGDLPRGAVIATCNLVDVRRITATNAPTGNEKAFGDYTPGRFMWFLEDVKMLPFPVPAKGSLGLWEWDSGGLEAPAPKQLQGRLL